MKYGNLVEFDAKELRASIERERKGLLSFGISFLDDCFFGIKKTDLITIGAEPGFGKTQIGTMIACHNALKGKKVFLYALESYVREIEKRIAYSIASSKYFSDKNRKNFDVCYPMYENNMIDRRFLPYAIYGEQQTEKLYRENLKVVHRGKNGYNVNNFVEEFNEVLDAEADLVITDHIGYFDEVGSGGERKSLSYAAKKMNEMVNIHEVPVIVITHIAKPKFGDERIVPDQHSIFGSSDIAKESTKVAFISKDIKGLKENKNGYSFPTLLYPAKFRGMGSMTQYVGCIDYDLRINEYSEKYVVGKLINGNSDMIYLQYENKPFWAKKGI